MITYSDIDIVLSWLYIIIMRGLAAKSDKCMYWISIATLAKYTIFVCVWRQPNGLGLRTACFEKNKKNSKQTYNCRRYNIIKYVNTRVVQFFFSNGKYKRLSYYIMSRAVCGWYFKILSALTLCNKKSIIS